MNSLRVCYAGLLKLICLQTMANNIWMTYLFDVFNLRLNCIYLFQNITVITAFISEETLVTSRFDLIA